MGVRKSVDSTKARRNDRDILRPFCGRQIRSEDRTGFGIGNDDKSGLALALAACRVDAAQRLEIFQRARDIALP